MAGSAPLPPWCCRDLEAGTPTQRETARWAVETGSIVYWLDLLPIGAEARARVAVC